MKAEPQDAHRQGAFFGRRKGKALRANQERLLETLLPQLALDLTAPAARHLSALFAFAPPDVRLEIGFGGGEHLIAAAEQNPQTGFIGVEPFVNGMAKALVAIEARGLRNIRLHHGDASDVIGWLPPASIARLDLLFADPWPKRRHWKRRFVQEKRLGQFARVLKAGGEFRFATDWPDYCAWTLRRALAVSDFAWTAQTAADWREPWPDHTPTRYEGKAMRAGRKPCYLTFRRA